MKKYLLMICAVVFSLSISTAAVGGASSYMDAPKAFSDVPIGHWSYVAVQKLAAEGISDGGGDGNFAGDKTITRYEMAQIVAKAMNHRDKADEQAKVLIEKLAYEYYEELVNLGARMTKTEKAIDRFTVQGDIRARYRNMGYSHGSDDGDKDFRFRLIPIVKINDGGWIASAEISAADNWRSSNDASDMNNFKLSQAFAQGPIGDTGVTVKLGKFVYWGGGGQEERTWSPMGNTLNMAMNSVGLKGMKLSFGKDLRTDVVYARASTQFPQLVDYNYVNSGDAGFNSKNITLYGVATRWSPTNKLDFQVNYNMFKSGSDVFGNAFNADKSQLKLGEFGSMYQMSNDWRLTGIAARTDADLQNNAYKLELRYKKADLSKAGSWALFGTYINLESNGIWRASDPGEAIWFSPSAFKNTAGDNLGVKGWSFETAYVPAPGSLVRAVYGQYKPATGIASQGDTNLFQLQYELFW